MRFEMDACEDTDGKLSYLSNRAYGIYDEKRTKLLRQYGLMNDDGPNTPQELIDRMASGKFVVASDQLNSHTYSNPLTYFQWRDPSIKKDQAGFDKADTELKKARTTAEDILVVMSDDATRLKALQDFESTTIN